MDIIFVRTKLQALIFLHLLSKNLISKKFIFVRCYQKEIYEDAIELDFFYNKIEKKAFYTTRLVEKNGLIMCSLQVYLLSILAVISCSKFFLAGINYYAFSIAAKFNPLLKIFTFDDGTANFHKDSLFFRIDRRDDSSFFRRLLNFLFPHGPAIFIRKKIIRHYTIFNNVENIVPSKKLKHLNIDWKSYLSNEDKLFLKKFVKSEVSVMIGTVFLEAFNLDFLKKFNIENVQQRFLSKCDFIIVHPRDCSNFSRLMISRSFHGTAESVIEFLQNQSRVKKINVYHLVSTVTSTIENFSKVKLYDIFPHSSDVIYSRYYENN